MSTYLHGWYQWLHDGKPVVTQWCQGEVRAFEARKDAALAAECAPQDLTVIEAPFNAISTKRRSYRAP